MYCLIIQPQEKQANTVNDLVIENKSSVEHSHLAGLTSYETPANAKNFTEKTSDNVSSTDTNDAVVSTGQKKYCRKNSG